MLRKDRAVCSRFSLVTMNQKVRTKSDQWFHQVFGVRYLYHFLTNTYQRGVSRPARCPLGYVCPVFGARPELGGADRQQLSVWLSYS